MNPKACEIKYSSRLKKTLNKPLWKQKLIQLSTQIKKQKNINRHFLGTFPEWSSVTNHRNIFFVFVFHSQKVVEHESNYGTILIYIGVPLYFCMYLRMCTTWTFGAPSRTPSSFSVTPCEFFTFIPCIIEVYIFYAILTQSSALDLDIRSFYTVARRYDREIGYSDSGNIFPIVVDRLPSTNDIRNY